MKRSEIFFGFSVAVMAIAIVTLSLQRYQSTSGFSFGTPAARPGGSPRQIDANRFRLLIESGKLSGKTAEFYTPSPETTPLAVPPTPDPPPKLPKDNQSTDALEVTH